MTLILSGLFGLFLFVVGAAFVLTPAGTVQAFGIDPSHLADLPLAPALGVREAVIGLTIAALAVLRQRLACGIVLGTASFMPIGDFLVAAQTFGYDGASRHLLALPVSLILGVALLRQ